MTFDDQDGGPAADAEAEVSEVVVWLRVDADHGQVIEVDLLGMRAEAGVPDPLAAPTGQADGYFSAEGVIGGSYIADPDDVTTPPTRFQARGVLHAAIDGGVLYAVFLPEGRGEVGFWMSERVSEIAAATSGPASAPGADVAVVLSGLGWQLELADVAQLERTAEATRSLPGRTRDLLLALGIDPGGPPAPGRPGAVPAEPVSGQVPAVAEPVVDRYVDEDDGDYVVLPRESRVPRWAAALLVLLLVVGVAAGGVRWWYQRQVDPPGGPGSEVTVVVPEGSSASQIGDLLARDGVITSSMVFNFWIGGHDAGPWQAGRYVLQRNSSFEEAIEVLDAGPGAAEADVRATVTIPEGLTIAQVLARIHEKVPRLEVADLQAALDQGKVTSSLKPAGTTSYEGLLFPATYKVGEDDDAVAVLDMMAAEMETRVEALDVPGAQARITQVWGIDVTAYDLVKVASMIQYEAAVPADAAKIGSVTFNRLRDQIPLGYDSTSIYEAGLDGRGPETVDYTVDTPYNTRIRLGLPPTPIAAPGEYALEGALAPIESDLFYFVLTEPKVVSFSETFEEFQANVQKCVAADLGCGG